MKSFNSKIFGTIDEPSTFDEIISLIQLVDKPVGLVRFWRGQSDIAWEIHSSAYRRLSLSRNEITEQDMQSYERRLLNYATHKGFRILNNRELSDFELLALLQHHGASTRFIDTSKNALIALWYSASSNPKKTGLLVGFHSYYIGGAEEALHNDPYERIIEGILRYNHPMTWEPPGVSIRVAAQQSQFLFSGVSISEKGSIKIPTGENAVLCIAISPKLKEKVLIILEQLFDIRYQTLFPDLDGFCYSNSYKFHEWVNSRW